MCVCVCVCVFKVCLCGWVLLRSAGVEILCFQQIFRRIREEKKPNLHFIFFFFHFFFMVFGQKLKDEYVKKKEKRKKKKGNIKSQNNCKNKSVVKHKWPDIWLLKCSCVQNLYNFDIHTHSHTRAHLQILYLSILWKLYLLDLYTHSLLHSWIQFFFDTHTLILVSVIHLLWSPSHTHMFSLSLPPSLPLSLLFSNTSTPACTLAQLSYTLRYCRQMLSRV